MTESESRGGRQMKRAVGKGLLILGSLLFLAAGLLYACKRDLNNGKNKSYEAKETGYTRLTAGDTIQQRLVVSHSFNGVSLTFGRHGVAANAGFVTVTILREEDGSAVMERILPVFALETGSSTDFAAAVDIPVSGEEAFEVRVGYHGLVGSSVAIQLGTVEGLDGCLRNGYLLEPAGASAGTGESTGAGLHEESAADSGAEQTSADTTAPSLVCGIVTQYSNHARNLMFSVAAVLLAFLVMCYLIHFALDLPEEVRHEREKKAFLFVYACVITIVFLIRLSYAEEMDTTAYPLGGTAENTLELLDDRTIDSFFELPADGIVGIQLSPMDTGDRILGEESLVVSLLNTDSGKVLQREEFVLKNQPSKGFYYLFDDTYEKGTRLSLHFQSVGLIGEGVKVGIASWPGAENLLYYGGARIEQQALSASMYAVSGHYDYTNALVRFAAELGIGVLFWYLLFVRRLPLYLPHWYDPVEQAYWVQGREILGGAPGNRKRMLRELAMVLVFGLVILEYVYSSGIGELPQKVTGEAVTYAEERIEDQAMPGEENPLHQTFLAGEDALSGFGIHLLEKDAADETLRDCADTVLHVRLIDAQTRETIRDTAHRVGDLTRLAEQAGADDIGTAEDLRNIYVYVPLEEPVAASEGHRYTLQLYAEQGEETDTAAEQAVLMIRGEEDNEGGQFNLILCYRLYQELPVFYFLLMGIALAGLCALCILTKWSRVPEWRLALFWMLLIGGMLTFLLPLFCVPDDGTHYRNIYYLSNRIFGVFQGIGGEHMLVRAQDLPIIEKLSGGTAGHTIEMRRYHSLFKELWGAGAYAGAGSAAGTYGVLDFFQAFLDNASVWTYLPSVLGFSLVRFAGGNFTMMIMAARWANLVVTTLLIVQAIRRCPYGQRALMVVAMFPILLQQIGSCSYDALTIGWAFMAISYGFHVLERTNHEQEGSLFPDCADRAAGAAAALHENETRHDAGRLSGGGSPGGDVRRSHDRRGIRECGEAAVRRRHLHSRVSPCESSGSLASHRALRAAAAGRSVRLCHRGSDGSSGAAGSRSRVGPVHRDPRPQHSVQSVQGGGDEEPDPGERGPSVHTGGPGDDPDLHHHHVPCGRLLCSGHAGTVFPSLHCPGGGDSGGGLERGAAAGEEGAPLDRRPALLRDGADLPAGIRDSLLKMSTSFSVFKSS